MGQYYYPVLLDEDKKVVAWVLSHDFGHGLKIFEHTGLFDPFMRVVEHLLSHKGAWYKGKIVWSGSSGTFDLKKECLEVLKIIPERMAGEYQYQYIVNHTKKSFVNKFYSSDVLNVLDETNAICQDVKSLVTDYLDIKNDEFHPLAFLCADGEDDGDYYGLAGAWVGDSISMEKSIPLGYLETTITFC